MQLIDTHTHLDFPDFDADRPPLRLATFGDTQLLAHCIDRQRQEIQQLCVTKGGQAQWRALGRVLQQRVEHQPGERWPLSAVR